MSKRKSETNKWNEDDEVNNQRLLQAPSITPSSLSLSHYVPPYLSLNISNCLIGDATTSGRGVCEVRRDGYSEAACELLCGRCEAAPLEPPRPRGGTLTFTLTLTLTLILILTLTLTPRVFSFLPHPHFHLHSYTFSSASFGLLPSTHLHSHHPLQSPSPPPSFLPS